MRTTLIVGMDLNDGLGQRQDSQGQWLQQEDSYIGKQEPFQEHYASQQLRQVLQLQFPAQQLITAWKLQDNQLSHTLNLYDAANAFGCARQEQLNRDALYQVDLADVPYHH